MTNSETVLGETFSSEVASPDQGQVNKPVQEVHHSESYLDALVGEGKKFSDVESLARAKLDADLHIKKLEEETKALRAKETNYDLILAKLEKEQRQPVAHQDHAAVAEVKNNNLDVDQLLEQFEAKLSKKEEKVKADNNVTATWLGLSDNYGNPETAKAIVQELITAKPYMKDVINKLGQTDPAAAIREILAFKAPSTIGNKAVNPMSSIPGVQQPAMAVVTWSDANKVRKNDIKQYASPAYQQMIQKSVEHYERQGLNYYKT